MPWMRRLLAQLKPPVAGGCERRLRWPRSWGLWILALALGCGPATPRYEGVARLGYRKGKVDLKFEMAFLRSEDFLMIVFGGLSDSDVREWGSDPSARLTPETRRELFRQFVHHVYARPGAREEEVEVCVSHPKPEVAARLANRIAETFLSARGDEARLLERASAHRSRDR